MNRSTLTRTLLPIACAGLLGLSLASAHAARVAVGVRVGGPVVAVGGGYGPHYGVHGPRGYYRGGGYGWGWGWGVGLGLGLVAATPWLLAQQPVVTVVQAPPPPVTVVQQAPAPMMSGRPEPVIYPRNGQSAQQTEADRQECNRWATTQPAAMADASIFHRAVEACMDGRGYTLR